MLSIFLNGKVLDWHVGEEFPLLLSEVLEVTHIYMDGDELNHIVNNFPINLSTSKRYFRLVGDFARQAIANL